MYNADETGLNYKMLPKRTYATAKEENPIGYKMNKERVAILCCGNVTGNHKMRLNLIGQSAKPRTFKKISSKTSLPLHYTNQKKAWMNSEHFKKWFHEEFVPSVSKFLDAHREKLFF